MLLFVFSCSLIRNQHTTSAFRTILLYLFLQGHSASCAPASERGIECGPCEEPQLLSLRLQSQVQSSDVCGTKEMDSKIRADVRCALSRIPMTDWRSCAVLIVGVEFVIAFGARVKYC